MAKESPQCFLRSKNGERRLGYFITFEGPEGSGKSSHCKLLGRYLKKKGYKVLITREPGGTRIGERLRNLLLDTKNRDISHKSEMLLYMASRAEIVQDVLLPALKSGKVVICDRLLDATAAYQGFGCGLDRKLIKNIGDFVTSGLKPDLTILLDMDIARGLKRSGRNDRIEKRSLEYHRRVRRGYLTIAKEEPERIKIVRVKGDLNQVQEKVRKIVMDNLKSNE